MISYRCRLSLLSLSLWGLLFITASAQNGSPVSRGVVANDQAASQPDTGVGVVSPATVSFGKVLVNQTSPEKSVKLENTGDSELTVSSVSISGNFAIPLNRCVHGIKPGRHCFVYVTFTPDALGQQTGTLTLTDNASNNPQTVSLIGEGSNTASTATTASATPTAILAGQPVTFTAMVKSLGGGVIPDGDQVRFLWRGSAVTSAPVHAGVASATVSGIYRSGQDSQRIVAQFVGDGSFETSSDNVSIRVSRYDDATVVVSSSPNPSVFGQDVTIRADVDSPHPVGGHLFLYGLCGIYKYPPGGTHTCRDMNHKNVGNYQVHGQFLGDGYDNRANGVAVHVINPTSTTTAVASSRNPSHVGQSVTLSVVVKAPFLPVQGSVTLTSGSITLGTIELSNGRGSLVTTALPAGQNTVTATYNPASGNYLTSSGSLIQVVQ